MSPRGRILHVMPSLYSGGMERGLLRLLAEFDRDDRGFEHAVCVLRGGDAALLRQCRGHKTWILGGDRVGPMPRAWLGLRRVVREFCPTVVHARSTGVWCDAAMACLNHPRTALLLAFHGKTDLAPVSLKRRWVNRVAALRADAVLSISIHGAAMMRQEWGISGDKLHVLPDGVDTQLFSPAGHNAERLALRSALQLPEHAPVAVCVANLLPIKALDVLLSAWRQVCMSVRGAKLLLVGQGPLRAELETLAAQLRCTDSVRFLGRREDVPDLLRASDLFLLSSRYEGTSNAIQEAMAAGLPVIATDVGGTRELVTPGKTGVLVPADSPAALAEAATRLLIDAEQRSQIGRAARYSMQAFSLQIWADRHASLYRELASRVNTHTAPVEPLGCAG